MNMGILHAAIVCNASVVIFNIHGSVSESEINGENELTPTIDNETTTPAGCEPCGKSNRRLVVSS
jgi:hypothetical protein